MTKKPNKNASSEKEEEKRDEELDEKSSSASDHFSLSDPDLTFEEILKQYDLASSNERAGLVGSVDDAFFKSTISNSKVGGAFMTSVLPQFNKFYDFRRAVERPNEFVLPSQRQARADVTFWVPHRNAPVPFDRPMTERELLEACVPVTFILEHKAQSGRYENAHTVAQAGLYTHIVGYQQVIERRRPFRQPIPVVVFNGSDVNVGPFLYGDYFPIDEELAEWGIHWKINCVNLTRLFVEGNLPDEPIARSLGIAMGASGAGTLHKDYPLAFEALSEIQEWDDPFNENYTRSLSVYSE